MDVAGLVPGAHQGRGLGNKFLDDLRHADALIHVVDVSGTTDAEGHYHRPFLVPLFQYNIIIQGRQLEDMTLRRILSGCDPKSCDGCREI